MAKHERQADDNAPLAKKVRYDDENPQELSFLDEVKKSFSADGADFGQVFLSLIRDKDQKDDILRFLEQNVVCNPVSVEMDAFLEDKNGSTWATHDVDMDRAWSDVVEQLRGVGFDDSIIRLLSKPSGPQKAALCCLWHYPTFTTEKRHFGLTLDRSNPCLEYQWKKIADNSRVRTQDTYPMRRIYNSLGPQWEELFANYTEDIVNVCHDFAKEALTSAPFSIVLGASNSKLVRQLLNGDEDLLVDDVSLRIPYKLFGRDPCVVIRDKKTRQILHVIFFSYHGMWFLMVKDPIKEVLLLHDLIWNAACQWSGVPIAQECFFSDRKDAIRGSLLRRIIHLRYMEKESGIILEHEEGRQILSNYLSRPEHAEFVEKLRLLPKEDSLLRTVLQYWSIRARATMATKEWQESEAAQRQRDGGAKGRATMATPKWQESEAAQRQRDGGAKGLPTRATKKWQESEAAQRQRDALDNGRAKWNAKRREMSTKKQQESEAAQRQRDGQAKGLATQATKKQQESEAAQRQRDGQAKGRAKWNAKRREMSRIRLVARLQAKLAEEAELRRQSEAIQ